MINITQSNCKQILTVKMLTKLDVIICIEIQTYMYDINAHRCTQWNKFSLVYISNVSMSILMLNNNAHKT